MSTQRGPKARRRNRARGYQHQKPQSLAAADWKVLDCPRFPGKRSWSARPAADRAATVSPATGLRPYLCFRVGAMDGCGRWHLGNLNPDVMSGAAQA